MRSTVRVGLLAGLAFLLGGCAQFVKFKNLSSGQETEWTQAVPAKYEGKECSEVLYDLSAYKSYNERLDKAEDDTPSKQVLLAVCPRYYKTARLGHVIEQTEKIEQWKPKDLHLEFDDRHPSQLKNALLVFWTAFPYAHNGEDVFNSKADYNRIPNRNIANAKFYAEIVDEAKLYEEMEAAGVPKKAQDVFLKNYHGAVARIDGRVAKMSEAEKILFVDVAKEVLEKRKKHFEANAELYGEYDKLLAEAAQARKSGADTSEVIKKLEDLRTRYLKECGKLSCQHDPLYAGASNELGMLYAASGDKVNAYLASQPFTGWGEYVVTFAQAVYEARVERGTVFRNNREKYRRAIDGGMDEQTAGDGTVRVDVVHRDDKIVQVGAVPVEPVEPEKKRRAYRY